MWIRIWGKRIDGRVRHILDLILTCMHNLDRPDHLIPPSFFGLTPNHNGSVAQKIRFLYPRRPPLPIYFFQSHSSGHDPLSLAGHTSSSSDHTPPPSANAFIRRCFNAGPMSATLAQHWNNHFVTSRLYRALPNIPSAVEKQTLLTFNRHALKQAVMSIK